MASLKQIDSKLTTQQEFTDTHLILTKKGSISVTNQLGAALKLNFAAEAALTLNLNGNVTSTVKPGNSSPATGISATATPENATLTLRTGTSRPTVSAINTNNQDGTVNATAMSFTDGNIKLGEYGSSIGVNFSATANSQSITATKTEATGLRAKSIGGGAKSNTGNVTAQATAKAGHAVAQGLVGTETVNFSGGWNKGTKLTVTAAAGSLTTDQSATAIGIESAQIQLRGAVATAITVSATSGNGQIVTSDDPNPQALATGLAGVNQLIQFSGPLKVTATAAKKQGEATATGMIIAPPVEEADSAPVILEQANAALNITATGNTATAIVFDNSSGSNLLTVSGSIGTVNANAQANTGVASASGINHAGTGKLTLGTIKGAWNITANGKNAAGAQAYGVNSPKGNISLEQQLGNLTVSATAAGDCVAAGYWAAGIRSNSEQRGAVKVTAQSSQGRVDAVALMATDNLELKRGISGAINVTAKGNTGSAVYGIFGRGSEVRTTKLSGAVNVTAQTTSGEAIAGGIGSPKIILETLSGAITAKAIAGDGGSAIAAAINGKLIATQLTGAITATASGDAAAVAIGLNKGGELHQVSSRMTITATSSQNDVVAAGNLDGELIIQEIWSGALKVTATGARNSNAYGLQGSRLQLNSLTGTIQVTANASSGVASAAALDFRSLLSVDLAGTSTVTATATAACASAFGAIFNSLSLTQSLNVNKALTVAANGGKNSDAKGIGSYAEAYAVFGGENRNPLETPITDGAEAIAIRFANSVTVTANAVKSTEAADPHATAAAFYLKMEQQAEDQDATVNFSTTAAARGKITANANTMAQAYLAAIENQSASFKQAQLNVLLDGGNWNVTATGKTGAKAIGFSGDAVAITAAPDESAPLTDLTLTATTATGRAFASGVMADAQIEYNSIIRNLNVNSTAKGTTENDSAVAFGLVAANTIDSEGNLTAASAGELLMADLDGNFKINAKSANGIARAVGLTAAKKLELGSVADNFKLAVKAESSKNEAFAAGLESTSSSNITLAGNWNIEAKGNTKATAHGIVVTHVSGYLGFQMSVKATASSLAEAFGLKVAGNCGLSGKAINVAAISTTGGAAQATGVAITDNQGFVLSLDLAVSANGGDGSVAIGIDKQGMADSIIHRVVVAAVTRDGSAIGLRLHSNLEQEPHSVTVTGAIYAGKNANAAGVASQLNKLLQNGGSAAGLLNSIQPPDANTRYLSIEGSTANDNVLVEAGAICVGDIDLGEGSDSIDVNAASQVVGNISNTESIFFTITQDATKNPTILGRTDINFLSGTQLSANVLPAQLGTYMLARGKYDGEAADICMTVNGIDIYVGETRRLDNGSWAKLSMVKSKDSSTLQLELLYEAQEVTLPRATGLELPGKNAPASSGSIFDSLNGEFQLYGTGAFSPELGGSGELFEQNGDDLLLKKGILA